MSKQGALREAGIYEGEGTDLEKIGKEALIKLLSQLEKSESKGLDAGALYDKFVQLGSAGDEGRRGLLSDEPGTLQGRAVETQIGILRDILTELKGSDSSPADAVPIPDPDYEEPSEFFRNPTGAPSGRPERDGTNIPGGRPLAGTAPTALNQIANVGDIKDSIRALSPAAGGGIAGSFAQEDLLGDDRKMAAGTQSTRPSLSR